MEAYARMRRSEGGLLAQQIKAWLLADAFVHDRFLGVPYARLHNARLALRRAITDALGSRDLLLTPTLPLTAPKLADTGTPFAEVSMRTAAKLPFNTAPLNLSGHPALSVPSGVDGDGLPTAVQIVAAHFDEPTAFRAAFALEAATGPFVP